MVRRVVSRSVVGAVVAFVVVVALSVPPAGASGSGGGVMDGSYVHSSNTYPPVVTYTALYFTGQLVVGGVEYDGGFYIAGMSEIGWGASGPCGGVCLTGGTSYQGGDPGAIHGFDPNYGAVTGTCSIVDEFDSFTGPAFLIEVDRQLSIACSGSVQGGPLTAFTLNVIAHSDGINDVVGAYTVS